MIEGELKFEETTEIVQVDPVSGRKHLVKAFTPEELRKAMREAPRAIGREPFMLGVRTAALGPEAKTAIRKVVEAAGPKHSGGRAGTFGV